MAFELATGPGRPGRQRANLLHEMCDEEKKETTQGLPAHAMLQCLIDLGGNRGYGVGKGNSHLTAEAER
jgi:hypothetical protein